jgi:hypothetical protein
MNWGKWIAVAFVSFAVFIGVLVTVCMREDVSLVSKKYYEEDLQFQQQFDQSTNAQALAFKPAVQIADQTLTLSYRNFERIEEGTITLMRPSDATLDHVFKVSQQQDTLQHFTLSDLTKGLYKVRVQWKEGEKEYRIDKTIVI